MMTTVPEATVDEESRDAIIELIKNNDVAGVRAMLQDLPQLLEGAKDWAGDGLLAIACWHERLEIAVMLVDEFHASLSACNSSNATPLHRACTVGNLELIRLLTGRNADIFARDMAGRSPADCGSGIVRDTLFEHAVVKSTVRRIEMQATYEQLREATIARRRLAAVPIHISDSRNDHLNGIYDPQRLEMSGDWPIYRHREQPMILLCFKPSLLGSIGVETSDNEVYDDRCPGRWVLEEHTPIPADIEADPVHVANTIKITEHVAFWCSEGVFPELRPEGANGIEELIDGKLQPASKIAVFPELFVVGVRDSLKLKEALAGEWHEMVPGNRNRGESEASVATTRESEAAVNLVSGTL